jgi:hypothetical protein
MKVIISKCSDSCSRSALVSGLGFRQFFFTPGSDVPWFRFFQKNGDFLS